MNKVYFKSATKTGPENSHLDQIKELFQNIPIVKKGDIVAIKIHPGEYGNTTYMRPVIVRTIVDMVKGVGGIPFITDTTVLYRSHRFDAVNLLHTASINGFNDSSMDAPFICADGLKGDDSTVVSINGKYIDKITVASAIAKADSMIIISHCKGHPSSGFGGAVKNLGMGCLDKAGKAAVHFPCIPSIDAEKCIGCGKCIQRCPWNSIILNDKKAIIDKNKCKGELSCIDACKYEAIESLSECNTEMQIRLGEAALGPVLLLPEKIAYINWIFDLTPGCDCFNFSAPTFSKNIGILASLDPVAIDKASLDLINTQIEIEGNMNSMTELWNIDPLIHLKHAEKMGVGSMEYILEHK